MGPSDAKQNVLETFHKSVISLTRTSLDGKQRILVLTNVGEKPVSVDLERLIDVELKEDLLRQTPIKNQTYEVAPYDIAWLA